MQGTTVLQQLFGFAHSYLEGTLAGVSDAQSAYTADNKVLAIAGQYAHVVSIEDAIIQGMIAGKAPLLADTWSGRTGLSSPVPLDNSWDAWSREATIDLAQLREYAQAVYRATDEVIAGLSSEDLDRPLDLSEAGLGQQTVGSLLALFGGHATMHCGEISTIKGLQGLQGYPS